MMATPALEPLTIPVAEPTETILVYDGLLHVPPAIVSASVIDWPAHVPDGPVIIEGEAFTVTVA